LFHIDPAGKKHVMNALLTALLVMTVPIALAAAVNMGRRRNGSNPRRRS